MGPTTRHIAGLGWRKHAAPSVSPPAQSGGLGWVATVKELGWLAGAVGVLLYAILSFLYDRFYNALGIEAEDVGLTQAVILSRAVLGLITLAGLAVAIFLAYTLLLAGYWLLSRGIEKLIDRFRSRLGISDDKWNELRASWLFRLPTYLGTEFPGITTATPKSPFHGGELLFLSVVITGAVAVLSFAFGLQAVDERVEEAKAGKTVKPVTTLFGLRVLDVHSQACTAHWLGDPGVAPDALGNSDLHCLGEADGLTVFRTGNATLRVPTSQVATSSE